MCARMSDKIETQVNQEEMKGQKSVKKLKPFKEQMRIVKEAISLTIGNKKDKKILEQKLTNLDEHGEQENVMEIMWSEVHRCKKKKEKLERENSEASGLMVKRKYRNKLPNLETEYKEWFNLAVLAQGLAHLLADNKPHPDEKQAPRDPPPYTQPNMCPLYSVDAGIVQVTPGPSLGSSISTGSPYATLSRTLSSMSTDELITVDATGFSTQGMTAMSTPKQKMSEVKKDLPPPQLTPQTHEYSTPNSGQPPLAPPTLTSHDSCSSNTSSSLAVSQAPWVPDLSGPLKISSTLYTSPVTPHPLVDSHPEENDEPRPISRVSPCYPLINAGTHYKYKPFALGDIQALVDKLPPLTDGGRKWLTAVGSLTQGTTLAVGDVRALLGRGYRQGPRMQDVCHFCQRTGHWAGDCRERQQRQERRGFMHQAPNPRVAPPGQYPMMGQGDAYQQ